MVTWLHKLLIDVIIKVDRHENVMIDNNEWVHPSNLWFSTQKAKYSKIIKNYKSYSLLDIP